LIRIDRVAARLIDALVNPVGVEELALVLSRIRVVSSNVDSRSGRSHSNSTRDFIIDA